MRTSRRTVAFPTAALVALGLALPMGGALHAQSTGGMPLGMNPSGSLNGHVHEGELGQLYYDIEHNLRCNCSCNLDVHSCQFQMQCDTSPVWSGRIRQSLQLGETREAIEASFVADFGRTVLMTPPVEGFNLVGYFLPAMGIVTMGMLIGLFVRRNAAFRSGLAPVSNTELDDEDKERLRSELRRLDETEGPDW